jgi:selenocysteine-specific elongation factor
MPREEARSRLKLPPAVFNPLLEEAVQSGQLIAADNNLRLPEHTITFTREQETAVAALLRQMNGAGINSPSVKECKTAVGEELFLALLDLGQLRQLNADVVYAQEEYRRMTGSVVDYLRQNGRINAAQVRDLLQTSRKYAIALLEHLDDVKVTRRVGDDRELV